MPFHHNRYQDFVQNSQTLGAKYVLVKNDTCKFCISLSNWSLYLFIVSCKFSSLNLMSSGRNKATLPEPDGPKIAILGYGVSSSKTGNTLARFIKYCSKYYICQKTLDIYQSQYQNQYRSSGFFFDSTWASILIWYLKWSLNALSEPAKLLASQLQPKTAKILWIIVSKVPSF